MRYAAMRLGGTRKQRVRQIVHGEPYQLSAAIPFRTVAADRFTIKATVATARDGIGDLSSCPSGCAMGRKARAQIPSRRVSRSRLLANGRGNRTVCFGAGP